MNFAYSSVFVSVNRVCCGSSHSFYKSPSFFNIHLCEIFSDSMTEQKVSIVTQTMSPTFIVIIVGTIAVRRITCKIQLSQDKDT